MFQDTDELALGIFKGLGSKKIAYSNANYGMNALMNLNLNRFGFNKSLAKVAELNRQLDMSKGYHDFYTRAQKTIGNFNVNYLRTEYNTAVAAAQNGSNMNQIIAEQDTFPYMIYQTAGDDKVRESHAALDGKVFNVKDKTARKLNPPNGHGCRCEFTQADEDDVQGLDIISGAEGNALLGDEYITMKKGGFNTNMADTGEIYKLNSTYAKQLNGVNTDTDQFNYKDAGLESSEVLRARKRKKIKRIDKSPEELLKDFDAKAFEYKNKRYNQFLDFGKKAVLIERENFIKHTSLQKYLSPTQERNRIFVNVADVLKSPDEVYLLHAGDNYFKYNYIRHYKDESILVSVEINKNGFFIKTWYKIAIEDTRARIGVLVSLKKKRL